jgi:NifU-like protein involved in Fe-S cluster formation
MPKYTAILMEHFQFPRNTGAMESPDAEGKAGREGSSPFMVLQLGLDGETITRARYRTFGCGPAIAAGSIFTEMIVGRPIEECLAITPKDVENALGGLPGEKRHCAALPVQALENALKQRRAAKEASP